MPFPCEHCGSEDFCKTQTRRVPVERYRNWKVGDKIWVRETFSACKKHVCGFDANGPGDGWVWDRKKPVIYKATCDFPKDPETYGGYGWRPSIHMPKWAARIFLEITGLREERVQDIREEDCIAEGIELIYGKRNLSPFSGYKDYSGLVEVCGATASFHTLWDSINVKRGYGWDKNPEIKVIDFEVLRR